ncbi:MAG: UDP-N-acetylglucosamine-N-acetylmuramyl-(pentapeptide) pyrophosphoryl-UDP N-acetylglucosamine transferase [Candidatus Magasanikbacteria bacterium GW2011_GWA2_56_11]|uniref:UDP-N-acetylglucosamine--N-acetylmuramyl-(pentapeptide) pyrophosphoryl-undecaprenol N-acetylglucosamine transferase n=1 Tax=Candidatus Magasanikbacteria bacterium GW2011_GWA2_56_11 TaxID=1619044 RepID=A0A0G2B860_9BACT|nr:MAG: UDP-N-acetylglucosamine-N-acetylmuramyl-(pentapeptide) pyrophosphoryl-UDP N-acetylglucosamine transferase [Candidatus Magasanikbacteria bacterium GW2011_GWA2_56_11]
MKIIFSGGGTLGPVTPLLAVHEVVKSRYPEAEFLWVGTRSGPERGLVEAAGIRFVTLPSGKFRRYLSVWNIVDLGRIVAGFFYSLRLLSRESPDFCVSAGGFISVPLHWASWLLGVPAWVHQQDADVGLANKLMAPFARVVSVVFAEQARHFSPRRTVHLGNPVRGDILDGSKEEAARLFALQPGLPVVFATGGGTGSLRLNQLVVEAVPQLAGVCQVIHLSGKERPQELVERTVKLFSAYYQVHQFFSTEMKQAYAAADIIISRGGFGTLSEIAALGRSAIIIPKPGHQTENAVYLQSRGAVIYVNEKTSDGNYLAKLIKELLADRVRQEQLKRAVSQVLPPAKQDAILGIVERLVA